MEKEHEQVERQGPQASPPRQRNLGPGVSVDLALGDHGLGKTVEALFGRVDFEIATIINALPLHPDYRRQTLAGLTELFAAAQADFERIASELPQVGSVSVEHRTIPLVIHSPHAGQFAGVVRAADQVLVRLRAAWILGQLPEDNHKAQARQVRGQLHQLAGAVDALFKACLARKRPRNGDGAGADGDAGAAGGDI